MTKTIKVKSFGKFTRENGKKIREEIESNWGWTTTLDFEGTRVAYGGFFDELIGELLVSYCIETIKFNVKLKNICEDDRQLLNMVISDRLKF